MDATSIYEAYSSYLSLPCLVKVQPVQEDEAHLRNEIQAHEHLKHEHIVQLYEAFLHQEKGEYYLIMVYEKSEKDLRTDINYRFKNRYPFTEVEIWTLLRSLVSACAYMERQHTAHRDICPECISLTNTKAAKLEGFGSSKVIPYSLWQTVVDEHCYFVSPLLRAAGAAGFATVEHDAYKSDVYSLGLVVLLMACLRPTKEVIGSAQSRVACLETEIMGLLYTDDLKNVLRWMLAEDEDQKPTFRGLEGWLNRSTEVQTPLAPHFNYQAAEVQQAQNPLQLYADYQAAEAPRAQNPGQPYVYYQAAEAKQTTTLEPPYADYQAAEMPQAQTPLKPDFDGNTEQALGIQLEMQAVPPYSEQRWLGPPLPREIEAQFRAHPQQPSPPQNEVGGPLQEPQIPESTDARPQSSSQLASKAEPKEDKPPHRKIHCKCLVF
jgi:serine/threonine protein kinase